MQPLSFVSLLDMFSNLMVWKYAPLLKNLVQSWAKPTLVHSILPTTDEDFSDMNHQLLGIPLAMAQRWCMLNKLNIHMVFTYFSQGNVPLAGVERSHYLNAFCLSLLARYFLVHEAPRVD